MKIAITADIHLQTEKTYPERYNALVNILDQMIAENIDNIIIAGDLFDTRTQNYTVFDELCKKKKYKKIKFYVIPGNHDPVISPKYFTADNIKIINSPKILSIEETPINCFFIPYILDKSMGEIIAEYKETLPETWVLIGHGDYLSGIRDINPYEPGIYMPLSRKDIEYYEPSRVILGHTHKGINLGKVYFPGSPCGIDINETGKRSFLVIDTDNLDITSRAVDTDCIFYNETLVTLPTESEFDYIRNKILEMINKWNLSKDEISKVRIRLKIKGYTSSKKKLEKVIKETLKDFTYYDKEGPDLTAVSVFDDPERISIVERVKEVVDKLEKNIVEKRQITNEDILEEALNIILKE